MMVPLMFQWECAENALVSFLASLGTLVDVRASAPHASLLRFCVGQVVKCTCTLVVHGPWRLGSFLELDRTAKQFPQHRPKNSLRGVFWYAVSTLKAGAPNDKNEVGNKADKKKGVSLEIMLTLLNG